MSLPNAAGERRESVDAFKDWIRKLGQRYGHAGLTAGSAEPDAPFLVQHELEDYLKVHTRSLLQEVSPSLNNRNFADAILQTAPRVFAILVLLDLAHYIDTFMRHDNLCDRYLPFLDEETPPPHFPTEESGFFRLFYEAQWHFCALEFDKGSDLDMVLHPRYILPITEKRLLSEGATSQLFKIEIHPAYDARNAFKQAEYVSPLASAKVSPDMQYLLGPPPWTYAMKVYQGRNAHECYMHEVRAFNHVLSNGLTQGIIGCFWAFRHGSSRSIILEYASDDLGRFLKCNFAPTAPEEIHLFWTNFGNVLEGIRDIHATQSLPNPLVAGGDLSPVLKGFHHDVKPENILVIGDYTTGSHLATFKLANLGLTRFRADLGLNARDIDTGSMRTYGAPEAAHLDSQTPGTTGTVDESADVWSFGCICLEVACWMVLSSCELLLFRDQRLDETRLHSHHFSDLFCFHDGEKLLPCAEEMIATIKLNIDPNDQCTRHILALIQSMLQPRATRKTSSEVLHAWKNVLNSAPSAILQQERMAMNPQSQSTGATDDNIDRASSIVTYWTAGDHTGVTDWGH